MTRTVRALGFAWALLAPGSGSAVPAIVDHHVHVLGPQLLADWKSLGVPFSREDSAYLSADRHFEGGVEAAILVPMAHLYGRQGFREALGLPLEEERARVARENDHVAAEAARHPGRAAAFCSVPLLRPYALDELERCRETHRSPGIKLHLAAAGVDLRDAAQLSEVERIVARAERDELTVLLHFDPQRRGLEVADVERFLDAVLAPHPRLELIVAHLGGSGGYGDWTRSVTRSFGRWLAARAAAGDARPGIRFDLSAVVLAEPSEGVPATTAEETARLAADLAELGAARLLFGSDAPVFEPARYADLLGARGVVAESELAALLGRRAPVLERSAAAGGRP